MLTAHLRRYAPSGTDQHGRRVCWVRPDMPVDSSDESSFIRAVVIYFMALHADIETMRNGITVVIDRSQSLTKTGSNYMKLQKIINAMPSRYGLLIV